MKKLKVRGEGLDKFYEHLIDVYVKNPEKSMSRRINGINAYPKYIGGKLVWKLLFERFNFVHVGNYVGCFVDCTQENANTCSIEINAADGGRGAYNIGAVGAREKIEDDVYKEILECAKKWD